MVDNHHLRGIILKLENRLSDSDRKRLHFFLGNDVPRRIRDDPTLGGTLSLIESLFDQDKINEQDFTFLINAFDEIQCLDAVKLLREHMRRMQSSKLHESVQTLASIMPCSIDPFFEGQDDDKYVIRSPLINQQYLSNNNIEMMGINSTNINSAIQIVDDHTSQSNEKKLFKRSSTNQKYLLFIISLLIIGLIILTSVIVIGSNQLRKGLQMKEKIITEQQAKINEITYQLNNLRSMVNKATQETIDQLQQSHSGKIKQNRTIQQLTSKLQQSNMEKISNNRTMQELRSLRSIDNQTIRHLNKQLQELYNEKTELNETIRRLNSLQSMDIQTIQKLKNQSQQLPEEQTRNNRAIQHLHNETIKQNRTIQQLTGKLQQSNMEKISNNRTMQELRSLRSIDNQTIRHLNKQLQELYNEKTELNETIRRLNSLQSVDIQTIQKLKNQSQQLHNETIKQNRTLQHITDELQQCQQSFVMPTDPIITAPSTRKTPAPCVPTSGGNGCGCPSTSTCRDNCISKFCGTDGRCSGFLDFACECLIGGVWQSKASKC